MFLGPLERLTAQVRAKHHAPWIKALVAVILLQILGAMIMYPETALIIFVCMALAALGVLILTVLIAILNEIVWIILGKRI